MRNLQIILMNIVILMLLFSTHYLHSQQSSNDSLAIKFYGAIKLTDSINSPLPDAIRRRILKYFKSNGLNPNKYYTTKYSGPVKDADEGYVGLVKIGALRDLYNMHITNISRVGSAGGDGDDVCVIFDRQFKSIKRISNSE